MRAIDVRSNSSDGIKDTLIVRWFIVHFIQENKPQKVPTALPKVWGPFSCPLPFRAAII